MKKTFSTYKNQGQNKTVTHQGPMSPEVRRLAMCNYLSLLLSNLNAINHLFAPAPAECKSAFLGISRPRSAK